MGPTMRSHAATGGVITRLFWRTAWHPLATIGGIWLLGFALGNAVMIPGSFVLGRDGLGTAALFSVGGALTGLLVWGASVVYVNRTTEGLESRIEQACRDSFGLDDVEPPHVSSHVSRTGSRLGLVPAETYRFTFVQLADETVTLFRAEFDSESYSLTTHSPVHLSQEQFDVGEDRTETLSIKINGTLWTVPNPRRHSSVTGC
jgi:hypothetical protein